VARRAAGPTGAKLLGSCNLEGSRLFHVLSGNLSFQIEHHLFPDLPSNRYAEIAPQIRAVCERHDRRTTAAARASVPIGLPADPAPRLPRRLNCTATTPRGAGPEAEGNAVRVNQNIEPSSLSDRPLRCQA